MCGLWKELQDELLSEQNKVQKTVFTMILFVLLKNTKSLYADRYLKLLLERITQDAVNFGVRDRGWKGRSWGKKIYFSFYIFRYGLNI